VLHELGAAFNPEGRAKLEGISKRLLRNLRAGQPFLKLTRRAPSIAPVHHIEPGEHTDAMAPMLARNSAKSDRSVPS
jgi:hypothetical protein